MAIVGIIAEYNPFHNGHERQIEAIRTDLGEDAPVVVCMSGAFTQRGSVALLPKDVRAKNAVENGADLVIELPTVFAVRSAQYFSAGGVRLLSSLGIVDTLAFGAECTDANFLHRIAESLDKKATQSALRASLGRGHSYAGALTRALALTKSEETALREPNTILAVEYLRAVKAFAPALRPLPLPRQGASHHDDTIAGNTASASAIRREIMQSGVTDAVRTAVPASVFAALSACTSFPSGEHFFRPLLAKLQSMTPKALKSAFGMSEGLENRILRAAKNAESLDGLIEACRSRRYPKSRIRRTLTALLLGFDAEEIACFDGVGPLYIRVLAFNGRGRRLLKEIQKKGTLPAVTRVRPFLRHPADASDTTAQRMLQYDVRASDLRRLALDPVPPGGEDFHRSPVTLA